MTRVNGVLPLFLSKKWCSLLTHPPEIIRKPLEKQINHIIKQHQSTIKMFLGTAKKLHLNMVLLISFVISFTKIKYPNFMFGCFPKQLILIFLKLSEAVTRSCSITKVVLKNSQNSQENSNLTKKETLPQLFFGGFYKIS